ncbi:MAG: hypothetical protein KF788_19375 [Piscinibacter sp.]|nr:hypothetical protein [Piscinibacter sp.]
MVIHYIPNDPRAGSAAPALRRQRKRAERPADRSGFSYPRPEPEGAADPFTPQFLFWQSREAAIAALRAWEACAGTHTQWQGRRRRLPLRTDDGEDLNAFYDRTSFSFFHQRVGGTDYFTAASTEVVAHEVGHGLLDSVRPDYFEVNFMEVGAFHEAFGDCLAILTVLEDRQTRERLLAQVPSLRGRNFVESFGEDLAHGINRLVPGHNAGVPRRAFNTHRFQTPGSLPMDSGPGVLVNEVHSFGMVFTGCFWDLIANLYAGAAKPGEAALRSAARLAGRLLIEGARSAETTPRFFLSVGRSMMASPTARRRSATREALRAAFARHAIVLDPNPPRAVAASRVGAAAPRARLTRAVALGALHPELQGVVALAPEPAGDAAPAGSRAGASAPGADGTAQEVQDFVASLLAHRRIALPGAAAVPRGATARGNTPARDHTTHVVREVDGLKVLQRTRFLCACHLFGPAPDDDPGALSAR